MYAIGIDISKGKSTVCIISEDDYVVKEPFDVAHTETELNGFIKFLKTLQGETRVIMECTGGYHYPVAYKLANAGLYVSALNPGLICRFGNNTIRRNKNDKADAVKIANYGLANRHSLPRFCIEDETRRALKIFNRQYTKYSKIKAMLINNFITLIDQTFPGIKTRFTSPARLSDGHEKWLDFAAEFWHKDCVTELRKEAFIEEYKKWCAKNEYRCVNADKLYEHAGLAVAVLPKNDVTRLLLLSAIKQINALLETLHTISCEMKRLAGELPEYTAVAQMKGVGEITAAQLLAEIGDVRRFNKKSALVCFAGLEPVDNESGKFKGNRRISKKGSPHLRKTLFQLMSCLLQTAPAEDPIFRFMDKKRAENKHYFSYMNAGGAKFLKLYYTKVKAYLKEIDASCEEGVK